MLLEDVKTLTPTQRKNIEELRDLVERRFLKIELSDDGLRVRFLGKNDRLVCSCPVDDFNE